ncbi:MAG: Crp/Fnr family transcriptional regulator [Acidobacteriaceae bacterium]
METGTTQDNCLRLLESVPLFTGLPERALDFLVRQSVRTQLGADELLFIEGDICRGLYVVESGLLKLYKVSPDGREQVLATYGPGYILSELPMIDGGTHPYCCAAVALSTVLFIPGAVVKVLCGVHAGCAREMLRIVASRMRGALGLIEELSFSSVRGRLAAYLLRLAGRDKGSRNTAYVQLPASHDIAAQIGTVRELVSRNLSQLQAEGVIRINRRTMHIPDLRLLAREISRTSHSPMEKVSRSNRKTDPESQVSPVNNHTEAMRRPNREHALPGTGVQGILPE